MIYIFVSTERGLTLTTKVHPLCIPVESNEDPKRWEDEEVEILGFATRDFSYSKADTLKAARVFAFTQQKCNIKLEEKLKKIEECKFLFLTGHTIFK